MECRVNEEEYTSKITSKVFWVVQVGYVAAALVFFVINTVMFNFKNVKLTKNVGGAHGRDVCGGSHQPLLLHTLQQKYKTIIIKFKLKGFWLYKASSAFNSLENYLPDH